MIPSWVKPVSTQHVSPTLTALPNTVSQAISLAVPMGLVLQPLAADTAEQGHAKMRAARALREAAGVELPEGQSDHTTVVPGPERGYVGVTPASEYVPVVDFGAAGVVRCVSCRAYLNPFVDWVNNGTAWRCNLCGKLNDCGKYQPLNPDGSRKTELLHASIEIAAPGEYMVRQPMPPTFVFCIDVSQKALDAGILQSVCSTLLGSVLPGLAKNPRALVGFVTFNSTVHLYSLKPSESGHPEMFVLPDLEDLFFPVPYGLLMNLAECYDTVTALLDSLPSMHGAGPKSNLLSGDGAASAANGDLPNGEPRFQEAPDVESATGPALNACLMIMSPVGGQILLFQAGLPSLGVGRLLNRENPRLWGTNQESQQLKPASNHYHSTAANFTRYQIAVNTFCFSPRSQTPGLPAGHGPRGPGTGEPIFSDVATLSQLSRYSGGQCFWYEGFCAQEPSARVPDFKDYWRLRSDLSRVLLRTTGWEAVLRLRCSTGLKVRQFLGNFYLRGTDLLSLPAVGSDASFGCVLGFDDKPNPGGSGSGAGMLRGDRAYVQSALLYTTSNGQRRIRVHTSCFPVTSVVQDLYDFCDANSTAALMGKLAVNTAISQGTTQARESLHRTCHQILSHALQHQSRHQQQPQQPPPMYSQQLEPDDLRAQQTGPQLPQSLRSLPLLVLGLMKHPAFRPGASVRVDARSHALAVMRIASVREMETYMRPRLLPLHGLPLRDARGESSGGDHGDEDSAAAETRILPEELPLRAHGLTPSDVLLVDAGLEIVLWVGREAPLDWVREVFGVSSLQGVDPEQLTVRQDPSAGQDPKKSTSGQVHAIVEYLRTRSPYYQRLVVAPQDSPHEAHFTQYLIEDRFHRLPSLPEFMQMMTRGGIHQ